MMRSLPTNLVRHADEATNIYWPDCSITLALEQQVIHVLRFVGSSSPSICRLHPYEYDVSGGAMHATGRFAFCFVLFLLSTHSRLGLPSGLGFCREEEGVRSSWLFSLFFCVLKASLWTFPFCLGCACRWRESVCIRWFLSRCVSPAPPMVSRSPRSMYVCAVAVV